MCKTVRREGPHPPPRYDHIHNLTYKHSEQTKIIDFHEKRHQLERAAETPSVPRTRRGVSAVLNIATLWLGGPGMDSDEL